MKKVFIKTYGCSFNHSDSENMAGLLEESKKYKIVDSEEEADIVIINSCTVKNSAETKFWRDIRRIKKLKILAGCVPQAEKEKSKFKGFPVIGTNQIHKVVEVVDNATKGIMLQLLKKENLERLDLPRIRKNPVIEIIPINEGCLGSCNFCLTKIARGYLKSYLPEDIVKACRIALNQGAKEIWLTSQDTACYGYDINTNIVELLKKILVMERNFKIRLGMGNPDFLLAYLDELIEIFKDPRVFKFIHIPVQSGSNKVLKEMKRNYTVENFLEIIRKFMKEIPEITIATDIICGYPGETEKDFEKTLELIKKIRPDVLNISRFWPRPGTVAARKKQLPSQVIKKRSLALTKIFHNIAQENNKKWISWQGTIIIDEHGKNNTMIGRNYAYKPVIIQGRYSIGQELRVKIKDATKHDLRAIVLA